MTQEDPALRPTIGEVIQRFDARCARLSRWQLRRPGQAHDIGMWDDNRIRQIKNAFHKVPPASFANKALHPVGWQDARLLHENARTVTEEDHGLWMVGLLKRSS